MPKQVRIEDGTYPLLEIDGMYATHDRCALPEGSVELTAQIGVKTVALAATIHEASFGGTEGDGTFDDGTGSRPLAVARDLGLDGYGYENCTVTLGGEPVDL